jgi:hypothetical protein
MSIEIIKAAAQDMEWLMGQLREFDSFSTYKRSLMEDDAYARLALKEMVDKHVCYIAYSEQGERMGFIAGFVSQHSFNPRIRVLTEAFWWVATAFRGSRAGLMLLDKFEDHGRKHFDWVAFSLESHSPVRPQTLERRGFAMKEQSFLLEV